MRPAETTHQQVIEAGLSLEKACMRVTGFSLRKQLGGGSPPRLIEVWNAHKANMPTTTTDLSNPSPELENLLQRIQSQITAIATETFTTAKTTADKKAAEVTRQADARRQEADQELAEAMAEFERLQVLLDQSRDEIEQLKVAKTKLETRLEFAEQQTTQAQQEAREATARAEQLQGQVTLLSKAPKAPGTKAPAARKDGAVQGNPTK
jgi:colicin import membrane protein